MLDRLPPELIALVIDFMNLSAWKRLQTLKALGLVSKSYWAAMRVIRERILFLPSTRAVSAVADVCAWPASRRQRIDTIIFGRGGYIPFAEDHLRFMPLLERLVNACPAPRHIVLQPETIFLGRFEGSGRCNQAQGRVRLDIGPDNPFRGARDFPLAAADGNNQYANTG